MIVKLPLWYQLRIINWYPMAVHPPSYSPFENDDKLKTNHWILRYPTWKQTVSHMFRLPTVLEESTSTNSS